MALIVDPQAWASFLALAVLEIVLGIDNILFLIVLVGRLPAAERASAPGFVDARASYGLPPAFAASLGPSPGLVWGLFCQEENAFVEAVFFLLEGIERGCG